MNEKNEQSKILETLQSSYEREKAQFDELNRNVDETKKTMNELRAQFRTIENEIDQKQKSKDDIADKLTQRDSMIAYHQRQIGLFGDAMSKYEVSSAFKNSRFVFKF